VHHTGHQCPQDQEPDDHYDVPRGDHSEGQGHGRTDEDELEIDGMTYQTIGDIIAEHFAEDIEDEVLDGLKLVPKDND
jgi:hypothetical protein